MTSFASPARVRFPRDDTTGQVPTAIAPGSFAVNWIDRKLFVGDSGGTPQLLSQFLQDWSAGLAYRTGDLVFFNNDLYRARVNISPAQPFTLAIWEPMAISARAVFAEPMATSLVQGGIVTLTVGFTDRISLTTGTGVFVNSEDPLNITAQNFTWPAQDVTLTPPVSGVWQVVGINAVGTISTVRYADFDADWRRDNVLLAFIAWISGGIALIDDSGYPAGGTTNAFIDQYFDLGGSFKASGLLVDGSVSSLALRRSTGRIFSLGVDWRSQDGSPNNVTIPAADPISMTYYGAPPVLPPVVLLDPLHYALAGVKTPVPVGKVTIQYLSITTDGIHAIVYGTTLYNSVNDAISALPQDWAAQFTTTPLVSLCAIVLPQNATIANTDVFIITAAAQGDPYATAAAGDTSAFLLLDGSRPMVGDLDMNNNSIINAVIDGGTY